MKALKSDLDWLAAIRENENEAIKQIYKLYREESIAWLNRTFRLEDNAAKDVFQMSVIILYDNVISGKLTSLSSELKTYLFSICKNKCLEIIRKNKKRDKLPDSLHMIKDYVLAEESENQLLEQKIDGLTKALNTIGDPCRQILQLFYYKKLDMGTITKLMKYKNTATTKNLKYKCIKRLQVYFTNHKIESSQL